MPAHPLTVSKKEEDVGYTHVGWLATVSLQEGLFTVTPLELDGKDAGAVRHALVCSSAHNTSDGATHLEVVKQASASLSRMIVVSQLRGDMISRC